MKKSLPLILFILTFAVGYFLSTQLLVAERELKFSGAFESLQYWNSQRAFPEKDIPSGKFHAAFYEKRSTVNKVQTTNKWEPIGPKNFGGRTISIAIDPENPDIIYAGSAGGGLWRSTTAGKGEDAWEYISTGFPVHGVGAIEINPQKPQEIYIGTGEVYNYETTLGGVAIRSTRGSYGTGVLKTTDGGETWTKSLDWSYNEKAGIQALAIDPVNPEIVWAGSSEGTFKSTNSGEDWELVHNTIMVTDILINHVTPDLVYIACGNLFTEGHGIYRTNNGGESWEKLENGLPETYGGKTLLDIYHADPNIIYASIGDGFYSDSQNWLCKTTDGGDSWEVVNTTEYASYQGWFSHFVVINQNDPDHLLAAGIDVWKSTNGGEDIERKSFWYNWYLGQTYAGEPEGPPDYSHADHHAFAVHPDDPNIVYFGNDGGVFVTEDFGETFEGRNGGYQTGQFYGGFVSAQEDSNLAIGGLQDNATAVYLGETSWFRAIGGDGCWAAINEEDNYLFGSWQYSNIRRTNNLFETQRNVSPPKSGASFVNPYISCWQDPSVMYAAMPKIAKSTNSGDNWYLTANGEIISEGYAVSMASSPFNDDVVFIGYAPSFVIENTEIFRTTNGGDDWIDVTGNLPNRYPMDIAFDYQNEYTLYIVFSGFGTSHLFKTTDLGETWIDTGEGLPDVPTSTVEVHPNNSDIIYVGNDLGVYVSFDRGDTWSEFNAGLPDGVFSMDFALSTSNDAIRLATHGNGVYESKLLNEPITSVDEEEVALNFQLLQNYPNPFNPDTKIEYQLPSSGKTTLKVFDALGQTVKTLVDNHQSAGSYSIDFDASNLSSGIYIYQLQFGSKQITKKMNFVK